MLYTSISYVYHNGVCPIRVKFYHLKLFNPFQNDKFLDWSKLKGFADDKINVT